MKTTNPYDQLKQIFHEPNRLAILSAVLRTREGLTFSEIKEACRLTDGNLSRHLRALENMKVVRLKKRFVGLKPQTQVSITAMGRSHFLAYLQALEDVLKDVGANLSEGSSTERILPDARPATT